MATGKSIKKDDNRPLGERKERQRPPAQKKQEAAPQKKIVGATGREVRGIVRIAGRDVKGEYKLSRAITLVRGIGQRMAAVTSRIAYAQLGLPENVLIGELSEEQLQKLEHILANPTEYGVPPYLVNHQKDLETGLDRHLISNDLLFTVKQDIERDKNMNTWRGYRHAYGQKVRGQHTRSTGRTGMTVGVMRKAVLAKQGAAQQPAKKEEEKKK